MGTTGRTAVLVTAALLTLLAGCGGSSSQPSTGQLSGTVTRVMIPGIPEGEIMRSPYADYGVEVYQGGVLRQRARTDAAGKFSLSVPAGRYRVKPSDEILERIGATISSQDVSVSGGQSVPVALEVTIPGA